MEIYVGIGLIVLALLIIVLVLKRYGKLCKAIKETSESPLNQIVESVKVASEAYYCQISGKIGCDNPLVTPDNFPPSVMYRYQVDEEVEEKGSDNTTKLIRTTVERREETAIFYLEGLDGENKIFVDFDTFKKIDYKKENYRLNNPLSLLNYVFKSKNNRKFKGFKVNLSYIPNLAPAFIIGEVYSLDGVVRIRRAKEYSAFSLGSKTAFIKKLKQNRFAFLFFASFILLGGIGLIALGI